MCGTANPVTSKITKLLGGLVLAGTIGLAPLAGCESPAPNDMSLLSVQAVRFDDVAEIRLPLLWGLVPPDLAKQIDPVPIRKQPGRLMLKVEFATTTNLSKLANENSYNISIRSYFCNNREKYFGVSFPKIFWRGELINRGEGDPISKSNAAEGSPIAYYVFFSVDRPDHSDAHPASPAYDLRKQPQDVFAFMSAEATSRCSDFRQTR